MKATTAILKKIDRIVCDMGPQYTKDRAIMVDAPLALASFCENWFGTRYNRFSGSYYSNEIPDIREKSFNLKLGYGGYYWDIYFGSTKYPGLKLSIGEALREYADQQLEGKKSVTCYTEILITDGRDHKFRTVHSRPSTFWTNDEPGWNTDTVSVVFDYTKIGDEYD